MWLCIIATFLWAKIEIRREESENEMELIGEGDLFFGWLMLLSLPTLSFVTSVHCNHSYLEIGTTFWGVFQVLSRLYYDKTKTSACQKNLDGYSEALFGAKTIAPKHVLPIYLSQRTPLRRSLRDYIRKELIGPNAFLTEAYPASMLCGFIKDQTAV